MCGIAGVLDLSGGMDGETVLRTMLERLQHRGPDDEGIEVLPGREPARMFLGHRRLAIIDLTAGGHQPMADAEGRYWISSNSEIYNHQELRGELNGYPFRSQSDTEVLLAAYARWNLGCLDRIRGMFAFGIWDRATSSLVLARDPWGIKPLYYAATPKYFLFASELRALLATGLVSPELDSNGLFEYLAFGRLAPPGTLVRGIRELPPGHHLTLSLDQTESRPVAYWQPLERRSKPEDAPNLLNVALKTAVRRRLVSDVPVGSFLSGGIDSSAVTQLAAQEHPGTLHTVSMGFREPAYDESAFSGALAAKLKTRHHPVQLEASDLLAGLPHALDAMDQPSVDGINAFFISRSARQAGLKVMLSGLGGDEVFGGYTSFALLPRLLRGPMAWIPNSLKSVLGVFVTGLHGEEDKRSAWLSGQWGEIHPYFLLRSLFYGETLQRLFVDRTLWNREYEGFVNRCRVLQGKLRGRRIPEQIACLELTQYMAPTLLRDMDAMSMAHGLEVRLPLIDIDLVRTALPLLPARPDPASPKSLLASSLNPPLPRELAQRRKMGFTLPFEIWMRADLKPEIEQEWHLPLPLLDAVIAQKEVQKIWNNFLKNKVLWSRPWALFVLRKWVRRHLAGS